MSLTLKQAQDEYREFFAEFIRPMLGLNDDEMEGRLNFSDIACRLGSNMSVQHSYIYYVLIPAES